MPLSLTSRAFVRTKRTKKKNLRPSAIPLEEDAVVLEKFSNREDFWVTSGNPSWISNKGRKLQWWFTIFSSKTGESLFLPEEDLVKETYCKEIAGYDNIFGQHVTVNGKTWRRNPKNTVDKHPSRDDAYLFKENRCQAILPCGKLCGRGQDGRHGLAKCRLSWKCHNSGRQPNGNPLHQHGVVTEIAKKCRKENGLKGLAKWNSKKLRRKNFVLGIFKN